MWEGWKRVSSVLTPVSVTLSWMWPNEAQQEIWLFPICSTHPSECSRWSAGLISIGLAEIARLLNNYSNIASTHHSPRSHKSRSHHAGMVSSHRTPTCPRLLPAILFSAPPPLVSQILILEYFRPQSQTLRSTLPSSRRDEASECPLRRRGATKGGQWEQLASHMRWSSAASPTKRARGSETKLTTPRGERLMTTRAGRRDTKGMLIYMTLDPFTASKLPVLICSVFKTSLCLVPRRDAATGPCLYPAMIQSGFLPFTTKRER